jgi:hypothetical protein
MEIKKISYEMEDTNEFLRWMEHIIQSVILDSVNASDRMRMYAGISNYWIPKESKGDSNEGVMQ